MVSGNSCLIDAASHSRGEVTAMQKTLAELNTAAARDLAVRDYLALNLAHAAGHGFNHSPETILERLVPMRAKALTPALSVVDVGAASPGPTAYAELVRRVALLGRIPGVRPAPMLARLNSTVEEPRAGFVASNKPIPALRPDFGPPVMLHPAKIAGIVPFTLDVVRHGDPAAFPFIQRIMTRAIAIGQDEALLDGAAAVDGERPASILYGATAVGGGSPADIETDISALVTSVRSGEAEAPAFITSMSGALYLATLRDSAGARLFPDVSLAGGTLLGVPVLISSAAAAKLVYLDGSQIFFNDSGGVEVESARNATLQLSDAPVDGAQNLVSLFQTGSTALRFIQVVSWRLAVADAVGFINLPLGSPVV